MTRSHKQVSGDKTSHGVERYDRRQEQIPLVITHFANHVIVQAHLVNPRRTEEEKAIGMSPSHSILPYPLPGDTVAGVSCDLC
jgi:hypothetical protein